MFLEIFLFEIRNRVRRPAFYLYFAGIFFFTLLTFATGSLPVGEKEHINSPYLITFWSTAISLLMTLASSSIMGMAIFRDIEYQTKDYYLTYPITKPGYFWGRFWGSFVFMVLIAMAVLPGIYLGTVIGPMIGKTSVAQYGPNLLSYYLYPFLIVILPNIFFTSAVFFGLVAVLRNVKVIYFGGILFFLFYMMGIFFMNHFDNPTIVGIIDPFAVNGVRMVMDNASTAEHNTRLLLMSGPLAINRLLWPGLGALIVMLTYVWFNFERFFAGRREKSAIDESPEKANRSLQVPHVSFAGKYNRLTLGSLTRLELLNILRDNYFWIIIGAGTIFLAFIFFMGNHFNGVPDFPRTVSLIGIFGDAFPFYMFFIIMFYCGETLQRDRITRYAFINDSLPPPNWVLNGSKLIALLIIGTGMSLLPMLVGVTVQLVKGYFQFNISAYLSYIGLILLPKVLEMVVFCYLANVLFNNKFAAYAAGVTFWVGLFFLNLTNIFNYHLLLYSYGPSTDISDMDGMGHMMKPVSWFDLYWLLFAGLAIIISGLFYNRGVSTSFKERLQLLPERFTRKTKITAVLIALVFIGIGGYIYYNVSYLNDYLTSGEQNDRAATCEKTLKRFEKMPMPKVTAIRANVDIYPDSQAVYAHAFVTIVNKNKVPVNSLLLDADGLSEYAVKAGGRLMPYTCPLTYPRGAFNWFRPKLDSSDFRLYRFTKPLAPGDSLVIEVNSLMNHPGFENGLYATRMLHNGTFVNVGLPGMGYDADDELSSPYERKMRGLAPKVDADIAQDDPEGVRTLKAGVSADLLNLDITASTSGDQVAIAPGELADQWKNGGRNYFHYKIKAPGSYAPFGIFSAHLAHRQDTVMLSHKVNIDVYYLPQTAANIDRYITAYKEGLKYYSAVYGEYASNAVRLAETPQYDPQVTSMPTMYTNAEWYGWNADFSGAFMQDYCYATATRQLAQQWWRFQVAPNNTVGSLVIPEGLAIYDELVMQERKYGKERISGAVQSQLWNYRNSRRHLDDPEKPVITSNDNTVFSGKAGVVLYGLRNMIGQTAMDSALNAFRKAYAYKTDPPFAGSNDLYRYLKKQVPDSLQYYLDDAWQKITFYDNKVTMVKAKPAKIKGFYTITFEVSVQKTWTDAHGNDIDVKNMNDYVDIAVYGKDKTNKLGLGEPNLLSLKRYKLTKGLHRINVTVKGEPQAINLDPYSSLIDRNSSDNNRNVD